MKKNIGIIFGGESVEHEISIITALQAIENIDTEKFNVIPVYISKENKFYSDPKLLKIDTFKNLDNVKKECKEKIIYKDEKEIFLINKKKSFFKGKDQLVVDAFFPIVHGTNVEDGKLQGYLETLGVPYIGTTTKSGVLGQDKSIMKDILKAYNIKQTKYVWINENQSEDVLKILEQNNMQFPVIIKPASLGSSIGISIANSKESLISKVNEAFKFDLTVVIEEVLENFEEFNISVRETLQKGIETSAIEKVFAQGEVLSYEDKYLNGSKGKGNVKNSGMSSLARELPAKIDETLATEIAKIAKETYTVLRCSGIIRIDMMVANNEIFVNEINNIPGSLAYYLWEEKGLNYKELLTETINEGIKKYYKEKNKNYTINTNVLNINQTGKLE